MKKFFQNFNCVLLLVLGLSNFVLSQEYLNYDDYVYEDDDFNTDDYDSFFDDDEYDIEYYDSANIGDLVYNPVTGRMQRAYFYLGSTLYLLDMQTGRYYPIRNRFRSYIGYTNQFYFDNFWIGRRNLAINPNFGRSYFFNRYSYYDSWRNGYGYRNFNNFNWGITFGSFNGFSIFFNNSFGPYSPIGRYYNRNRRYRNWWGWFGPGGWNIRENNNRSNFVNVGGFDRNRNTRVNYPVDNQGRNRPTINRQSPRSENIINARSRNPLELADRTSTGNSPKESRIVGRSIRSRDIVESRKQNRADIPSRGQTVRIDRSQSNGRESRYTKPREQRTKTDSRSRIVSERTFKKPDKANRSSYDRDRGSKNTSRQRVESRSRNPVKTEKTTRARGNNYESRNRSSSQSSYRNRSKSSQLKYSSNRKNNSSLSKQRSKPYKSKKSSKRF